MPLIEVNEEELKLICDHRAKKLKSHGEIRGKFSRSYLEAMLWHIRNCFGDYVLLKPDQKEGESFYTDYRGLAFGFTQEVSKTTIEAELQRLNDSEQGNKENMT